MSSMVNYELREDRLRIKVRKGSSLETYTVENLPQEFQSYLTTAREYLKVSSDPTLAKMYRNSDALVYIWYKPVWRKDSEGKNVRIWPPS